MIWYTAKNAQGAMMISTAMNNVVLPTLFNIVNNIVQHC